MLSRHSLLFAAPGLALLLALGGCGRLGFEAHEAPGLDGPDAGMPDADTPDTPDAGDDLADVSAPTGVSVSVTAQVETLAGSGQRGYLDGDAASARFHRPEGIATDDAGNVFVADRLSARVRMLSPEGQVTTVAGNGDRLHVDGAAEEASFTQPEDVAVDAAGNIYVADANAHAIRRISPDGDVTTLAGTGVAGFADGEAGVAQFNSPEGVVVAPSGDVLVSDTSNNRIRRITPEGTVTTIAGTGNADYTDGPAELAEFQAPEDLDIDSTGALIIADASNSMVRRISPDGVVDTLAGTGVRGFVDGEGTVAQFSRPDGLAVDVADNVLVADTGNHSVRLVTPDGFVTTIAGNGVAGYVDGEGAVAQFSEPSGAVVDHAGNLLLCEESNDILRRVVGGGPGRLGVRWELALDSGGEPVPHHRATASAAGQPPRSCEARFAGTVCTIAGLVSGVSYDVVVVAVDAEGREGPPSEPVVAIAP